MAHDDCDCEAPFLMWSEDGVFEAYVRVEHVGFEGELNISDILYEAKRIYAFEPD